MRDGQTARKPRGPHPERRLTPARIRATTAPGRYADGNGLYLFVDPTGAKRWVLRTLVLGRRRDIGLGSLRLVSLSEARDEATRLRRLARDGADPLAERTRARRGVMTFKAAALEVHKAHASTFRNVKHRAQWLSSLEADVFPVFGDRPVSAIGPSEVLAALGKIWTTKPETARRLKQRIRVVLDWAKASGHRDGDNPVDGITRVLPKVRQAAVHHPALPYSQLPAFVRDLRAADAGVIVRLAFEFLILTAARTGEVLQAQWSEIDRQTKTWTIPADRMKAGREHRVPLSARALELLKEATPISGDGPFVFSGRAVDAPLSNMALLMVLRRMKRAHITAHGFRSAFRDWAAERTNVPRAVCEAALAHVVRDKTEAAYFRSDLFELRRKLMNQWAAFATASPGDVVSIRR